MSKIIQIGTPALGYYKNILMRANPSLHKLAFEHLASFVGPGASVVDLGSGQGAFALRLQDHGYIVTSVDKNPADFLATSVPFIELDFDKQSLIDNYSRDNAARFDVVIGMEVIEHVENPWNYIRLLLSLAKPGGIVMITTPNSESIHSRLEFVCSGFFTHFSQHDYTSSGHINPLTFNELNLIFDNMDVDILYADAICPLPWVTISRRISTVLLSLFSSMIRPFLGNRASGDIICFIVRKPG